MNVAVRILSSVLALAWFTVCAAAQTAPPPPGVTVLEHKWKPEIRSPALEKNPFAANNARQMEEQAQKDNTIDAANRQRQGENAPPPVTRQTTSDTGNSRLSVSYTYEIKVRNDGAKEIRMLIWEYVFFEPGTTQEVGRRRFVNQVKIKPGAIKHLIVSSPTSPAGARRLDASKAG